LRQVEVLAFDYPGRDKLMKAMGFWIIAEDRLGISSAITMDPG